MSGHTVIHAGQGASFKAHVMNAHVAAMKTLRATERRDTIMGLLFEGRQRKWVTEDAARHGRRRSLIDDNPTSG